MLVCSTILTPIFEQYITYIIIYHTTHIYTNIYIYICTDKKVMYLYAKSRLKKNALSIVEHTKTQKGVLYIILPFTIHIMIHIFILLSCITYVILVYM